MSKQSIKATIDANVKQNGVQAITGQVLNSVLNQMVSGLGAEDEVVHKEGSETITGIKTFAGSLVTNGIEISGEQTSINIGAEAPFQDRADQLIIEGNEGDANILVQRDPLVPLELATKRYVDSEVTELARKVDALVVIDNEMV